jgi:hypothetical protein
MIALALNFLDLFLKPKTNPSSWLCTLGTLFVLMGAGFGLYFGFEYLVPLLGRFETGLLLSSSLILVGVILMLATRCKKQHPVINKALDTFKEKAGDLHLKETFDHHKELIMAVSVIAGVLLPLWSRFRKGQPPKNS